MELSQIYKEIKEDEERRREYRKYIGIVDKKYFK